jgi:hypothetical protein
MNTLYLRPLFVSLILFMPVSSSLAPQATPSKAEALKEVNRATILYFGFDYDAASRAFESAALS